jgi:hypothetical protein
MWRRCGDAVYTPIALAIFGFETMVLGVLGLYLLSYHFVSAVRDRHHGDQLDSWTYLTPSRASSAPTGRC